MGDNILLATLKYIFVGILWDIIYFPIWWYTKGLVRVARWCVESATFHWQRRLALGIWLKSFFKPMYGDTTREGRIISIFMRFVVLIGKLISAVVWFILLFVVFVLWLALPVVIVYYILYQTFSVPFFTFT